MNESGEPEVVMQIHLETALICCMSLLSACTHLAFQPSKQMSSDPAKVAEVAPEKLSIQSGDGTKLALWHFHANPQPTKGIVVQFHGNAENMSAHFMSLLWLVKEGYDLITFDYRGYGDSAGSPSFPEVSADGLAAIHYAITQDQEGDLPIIIYGQSLGGIIAISALETLAETHQPMDSPPLSRLVLEGSFYSLKRVSANVLTRHWLTWPFSWFGYLLMSNRASPKKTLRALKADTWPIPKLVIHSQQDPVIPFKEGQRLHEHLAAPKCFKAIPEQTHINTGNIEEGKYRTVILEFLQSGRCMNE